VFGSSAAVSVKSRIIVLFCILVHTSVLFLTETYYSPPFRQVISTITAEYGSSLLEYYVQFEVPQCKNNINMYWNESSGGPLG